MTKKNYAAHYTRAAPVLRAWGFDGELGEGLERLAKAGHKGVYRTIRDNGVLCGRPWGMVRDLGPLSARDRTIYGYLNFVDKDFFESAKAFEQGEEGEKIWVDGGENPLPGYRDIEAMTLFCDVDLRGPREARFDDDTKAVVVDAMRFVAQEFAGVCPHSVRMLDSGGGFYPHIHHKVTRGLTLFEGEDRGMVFKALCNRFNEWLAGVEARLFKAVPGSEDLLKLDKLNHNNRVFKAPLSLHGSLDVLVHPVDPGSPDFEPEPYPMRPGLVEETLAWVERRPSDEEAAEDLRSLVFTLWPDTPGDTGRERLENWLRGEKLRRAERERELRAARERARDLREVMGDGVVFTSDVADVVAAVDAIDVQEVAREVAAEWDTAPGRDPPRFKPAWRDSDTRTSCFASSEMFYDLSESGGGDAAKLVARARGIIPSCSAGLTGEAWWRAVECLRADGHPIPVYIPGVGEDYDRTPLWALRRVAVVSGVLGADDFVEREGEDGGVYLGFPDYYSYHRALLALEEAGVPHGREDLISRLRVLARQKEAEYQRLAGGDDS